MALPCGTTGSLRPTFVPARAVALAVKLPYAFALFDRFPFGLREPLCASVTFLEATAPVKLPTRHCPYPRLGDEVRYPDLSGWYFNDDSMMTSATTSKSPTYSTQTNPNTNAKL